MVANRKIPRKTDQPSTVLPFKDITVIGDSHARGLAAYVQKAISYKTNVTWLCKPGAGLLEVAPTSVPPVGNCYVLLAGTNDVATGSQHIIFKHMETVLENCSKHSKVLTSPLLPRHDLSSRAPFTTPSPCDIHRHHFTPHGLHLTDSGKRLLSCQIVKGLMSIPLRPTQSRRPVAVTRSSEDTTMPPASNPAIPVHPKTLPHESYADAVRYSGHQRISSV
ncbi:hypothetical protein J6590_011146 [Homalodisca vitripennis]|nr:hypothetical protein J6590_011146 [Homalodisca vitripennis]